MGPQHSRRFDALHEIAVFELSPLDPITYVAAPLLLIAAAVFAVTRSHRIVCLDPTQALKSE
jgi:hypothetical protein